MRGYQKRVVFLKNPDSDIFDEAYFVLKDTPHGAMPKDNPRDMLEDDIIKEAYRIVGENINIKSEKSRMPRALRGVLLFGGGFFSAALFFWVMMII